VSKISSIFNFFDEISRNSCPEGVRMTSPINSHKHANS